MIIEKNTDKKSKNYPIYFPVSNLTTIADFPTPGAPTKVIFIDFSFFSTFDKFELEWWRRIVKVFRFKNVTEKS